MKAHTEAESAIAPALTIDVEITLGPDDAEKIMRISLSKDTILRSLLSNEKVSKHVVQLMAEPISFLEAEKKDFWIFYSS